MTTEEAIRVISRSSMLLVRVEEHRVAIGVALNALKKAEKYKWHDLRKNPNDLPHPEDEGIMYECVLENHIYEASYPSFCFDAEYTKQFGYYNNVYSIMNGADEFATIEDMGYEKVIAWREIERFEEVNEWI